MHARVLLLALPLLILFGCEGNALKQAEMANTPESWEGFLESYPDYAGADEVRRKVDVLRWKRAKKANSHESYSIYLTHHPEGNQKGAALAKLDLFEYEAAVRDGSIEAYKKYLSDHPEGAYIDRANTALSRLDYLPNLTLGPASIERTNMADDPKGDLNGWRLKTEVTNNGDKTLRVVELHVDLKNASGELLKSDRWWAVAPDLKIQAAPPSMRAPLEPGGVRTFEWTYADMDLKREAEGATQFIARVTDVQFK